MPSVQTLPIQPRWYLIPVRIVVITFLMTLLSFALSLLLGILGLVITSRLQAIHPNMTVAYRHIALPVAALAAGIAFVATTILEIRTYRQTKTLAQIARSSQ
jgi:spore maturation protein SpmA